ncbi:murein DD-endopeptidase MepM/ murein hydrolase activator NlpD [Paenibacillus turicensis]|uniref:Murein DD-endopeptidase MepM/ murein hydrolase activator NlpD n=1 Tax=Paenibacillus turicensis TaxID=160487 RepID=A0ABS4FLU2_9BACL|nr:M23 family metallopeptidase [Paenibacillus turicensis]MBP1903551.1 murein DD-endopeptidase MepM/ murein hydrolase activator NlpD [Paenibacillus turicensis]
MKNTNLSRQMTILVVREAHQPVRQIQLSKPLIIVVPMVALLSISGLIVHMKLQSNQQIAQLQQQVYAQQYQFDVVVTNKEQAITRLQNEVIQLSAEAKNMVGKLERVSALEDELQRFINKYHTGSKVPASASKDSDDFNGLGGEFIAVHDNEIDQLAIETHQDYEMINKMLNEMEKNLPITLKRARQTQYSLSGTPSGWPTLSTRLTSNFGYRTDPFSGKAAFHAGIDIGGKIGDPVYAAAAGTVITSEASSSRGNYIVIQHPNGIQSWYLHLQKSVVAKGEQVTKGQNIGKLGNTGRSTGAHLHFEIMKNNQLVDPLNYVSSEQ